MDNQKVSVIVPVRNTEKLICACLQSLIDQEHKPDEIIVVDNISTDATESRVKEFIARSNFPAIVLVAENNPGAGPARNHGVALSRNDIIAFIDADCEAAPDWLKQITELFEREPTLDMVVGHGIALQTDTILARLTYMLRKKVQFMSSCHRAFTDKLMFRSQCPIFAAMNLAVRKNVYVELSGFDETFARAAGEDTDFALRAISIGKRIEYYPQVQVYHNERNNLLAVFKQVYSYEVNDAKNFKRYFSGVWAIVIPPKLLRLKFGFGSVLIERSIWLGIWLLSIFVIISQGHWLIILPLYFLGCHVALMFYLHNLKKRTGLGKGFWELVPMAFYYQIKQLGGISGRLVGSVKYRVFYL